MNKMKKLLALALCLAMVLALAACGGAGTDIVGTSSTPAPTEAAEGGVLTDDEAIYMAALGDFYEVYQEALAAESLSERWALMAVAEAKFLESGRREPDVHGRRLLRHEPHRLPLRRLHQLDGRPRLL